MLAAGSGRMTGKPEVTNRPAPLAASTRRTSLYNSVNAFRIVNNESARGLVPLQLQQLNLA